MPTVIRVGQHHGAVPRVTPAASVSEVRLGVGAYTDSNRTPIEIGKGAICIVSGKG
jgi:hypothetical protein